MPFKKIFKQASTTYFNASLFFPKNIRRPVFELYAFVRLADDFVDQNPSDAEGFERFVSAYQSYVRYTSFKKLSPQNKKLLTTEEKKVIAAFVKLQRYYQFEQAWVDAFLETMRQDISPVFCKNLDEVIAYMYGSAEVIGLMLAAIMDLPQKSHHTAQLQGRAMQYINFIRDIAEDIELDRQYLPEKLIQQAGLSELSKTAAQKNPTAFAEFINQEVDRYKTWQAKAAAGYHFLPWRVRVAVKTAASMYAWTADQLAQNPQLIFETQLKPSKWQVLTRGIQYFVTELFSELFVNSTKKRH